jgi:hypothetical protein
MCCFTSKQKTTSLKSTYFSFADQRLNNSQTQKSAWTSSNSTSSATPPPLDLSVSESADIQNISGNFQTPPPPSKDEWSPFDFDLRH